MNISHWQRSTGAIVLMAVTTMLLSCASISCSASPQESMRDLLREIESNPKPSFTSDLTGAIDGRWHDLAELMNANPADATEVFRTTKSTHLKAQLLYAASKTRRHVEFLQMAIEEYSTGDAWWASIGLICNAAPEIAEANGLSVKDYMEALRGGEEYHRPKINVDLSKVYWEEETNTYRLRE